MIENVDHISDLLIQSSDHKISEQQFANHKTSVSNFDRKSNTYDALKSANEVFRNWRKNTQKVIIFLSTEYSTGDDPRPLTTNMTKSGVKIYTIGVNKANVEQLKDMASEPKDMHHFIVESFDKIEFLVKQKINTKSQTNSCISLCKEYSECCDANADCVCDTNTGIHSCVCKAGYYGSGILGNCNLITCPETSHPVFNKVLNRTECQCKKGYQKIANKCEVLKCPKLVAPDNGFFSSECSNVYNAACGIICRPGYELKGTSIRICTETGTWNGIQTQCQIRKCPKLSPPVNGSINCSTNDFRFATICYFNCENGFQLQGSRERTCLAIAKWDGLPVSCKPITTFI